MKENNIHNDGLNFRDVFSQRSKTVQFTAFVVRNVSNHLNFVWLVF